MVRGLAVWRSLVVSATAAAVVVSSAGLARADASLEPGAVATVAGTASSVTVDGVGSAASFKDTGGLVLTGSALFVSSADSIRRVETSTGSVTTLAGGTSANCGGDSAVASQVSFGVTSSMVSDGTSLLTVIDCGGGPWLVRSTSLATGATTRLGTFTAAGSTSTSALALIGSKLYMGIGSSVVAYDLTSNTATVLASVTGGARFLSLTSDGTNLWSVLYNPSASTSQLAKVTVSSGAVTRIGSELSWDLGGPGGSAIADAGAYVFVSFGNGVRRYAKADATWVSVAGSGQYGSGVADGTGTDAWFANTNAMVYDGVGLWVADGTRVRRITQGTALPSAQSPTATVPVPMTWAEVVTLNGTGDSIDVNGPLPSSNFQGGRGMVVVGSVAYVATYDTIRKVDLATSMTSTLVAGTGSDCGSDGVSGPSATGDEWMTTDGYYLYLADRCGRVRRVSIATGAVSTVVNYGSTTRAGALAMGPDGYLYMAGKATNGGAQFDPTIYRIDPRRGTSSSFASEAGASSLRAMAADADYLWVVAQLPCTGSPCGQENKLDRVSLSTGVITTMAADVRPNPTTNTYAPSGTTLVSAGGLLYGDATNKLRVWDKATGAMSTLAGHNEPNDGLAPPVDGVGPKALIPSILGMASTGQSSVLFLDNPGWLRLAVPGTLPADTNPQSPAGLTPEEDGGGGNDDKCACNQPAAVDPVNTFSGELWERATDVALPGRGAVTWDRTYSTLRASKNSLLGYGWTGGFLEAVTAGASASDPVKVTTEHGAVSTFTPTGVAAAFLKPGRIKADLAKVGSGASLTWVHKRRNDLTATFDKDGKLLGRSDRNGHSVGVTYGDSANPTRPTKVTTQDGRQLTVAYNAAGRIASVTGPSGTGSTARKVSYAYDTAGNLTTVTDTRGKVWTYGYDAAHRMTSITSPTGEVTTTSYNAAGKVDWQRNPRLQTTTFTYTDTVNGANNHRKTRMTDSTGVITDYDYDNGWLTQKTVAPGTSGASVSAYNYDPDGNLTGSIDPSGVSTTATFDANGNKVTQTVAAGATMSDGSVPGTLTTNWTYNEFNKPVTETDALGRSTRWAYDKRGNVTTQIIKLESSKNAVTTWTRNDSAHPDEVTTMTDPIGVVTTFTYTAEGFVQTRTTSTGPVQTVADLAATTSFTYTPYGDVLTTVDPRGNATGGVPSQYTTTNTYDAAGLLLTTKTPLGYTTTYTYDGARRRVTVKNSAGKIWTTAYLPGGLVDTVTDPLTHVTLDNDYDGEGRLTSSKDATANITRTTYDDHGRPASTTRPSGNVAGATQAVKDANTMTFGYDKAGRLLASTTPDPTGGAALATTTSYDGAGRVWKQTDAAGLSTATTYDGANLVDTVTDPAGHTTTYRYDYANRVTREFDPANKATLTSYDNAGHILTVTDPLTTTTSPGGRTTSYTYNSAGLLATKVEARGNATSANPTNYTTTYLYDIAGNLAVLTDPLGGASTTTYDRDNRVATRKNPKLRTTTYNYAATTANGPGQLSKITAPDTGATLYAYDAASRRTSVTAPTLGVWLTGYDDAGRVASETDPAAVTRTYTYTPDGALQTQSTPRGTLTRAYNPLGQLTALDYSDTTPDLTFGYDRAGRRASMTDAAGSLTYTYDPDSRPLSITRTPTTGTPSSWGYGYDQHGNVTTRTRPDTSVETWTYDVAQQPTQVIAPTGTTTWTYDDAGNPLTTALPNGTTETRTWDRTNSLASITTTAGATVLTSQTVTRDAAGQPTKTVVTRNATTETRGYAYDSNERLADVCYTTATCTSSNSTQHWTYDKNGNRLTERNGLTPGITTTSTYDSSDRIISQKIGTATATTPTYDADGNMTADGTGRSWTYGLDGLTRTATTPTSTTAYSYDGDGRRLASAITAGTGTGATTSYTWDSNAALTALAIITADPDGTGPTAGTTTTMRYDSGGAGTPISQTTAATTNWYAHDPLGGITDLTSTTATITRTQDWTPYGATRTPLGAPATPTGPLPALGWTGALADTDNTWHLRARQYDPATSAFITRDPAGQAGSVGYNGWYGNPYGYVTGRATYGIDPTGRNCWNPWSSDGEECAVLDGLARTLSGANDDSLLGSLAHNTSNVAVNFGRGASGGLTDTLDDRLSAGSSCTVDGDSLQAKFSQGLGLAASVIATGGTGAFEGMGSRLSLAFKNLFGRGAAESGGARFVVGASGDVLDTAAVTIPKGKFGYLLENPSKSGVFRDSMGFDQAGLDQALRSHLIDNFGGASGLSPMVGGGSKFSVRGGMTGPSGASWNITSVWGIDTNGTVRLITATP